MNDPRIDGFIGEQQFEISSSPLAQSGFRSNFLYPAFNSLLTKINKKMFSSPSIVCHSITWTVTFVTCVFWDIFTKISARNSEVVIY